MNLRNTTKMVEHNLVLFATVIALSALATLLIKQIRLLLKCKTKIMPFCESWAILSKMFHPAHRAGVFIEKIFIPVTEILVAKISVNGPTVPLIRTHRYFYKEKSGVARSRKPSQPGWPGSYGEAPSKPWNGRRICSAHACCIPAVASLLLLLLSFQLLLPIGFEIFVDDLLG